MSKADNTTLDSLHGALAKVLLDEIKKAGPDPKGRAAILNVARQFLKDNGIEALPSANKPLQDLAKALPFPEAGEGEFRVQ